MKISLKYVITKKRRIYLFYSWYVKGIPCHRYIDEYATLCSSVPQTLVHLITLKMQYMPQVSRWRQTCHMPPHLKGNFNKCGVLTSLKSAPPVRQIEAKIIMHVAIISRPSLLVKWLSLGFKMAFVLSFYVELWVRRMFADMLDFQLVFLRQTLKKNCLNSKTSGVSEIVLSLNSLSALVG